MKDAKELIIGLLSLAGLLIAFLFLIWFFDHVRAVAFDRISVHQTVCRKEKSEWQVSAFAGGFPLTEYRVSFRDQLVVAGESNPRRLKGCTVADAEHWHCDGEGTFPAISADGGDVPMYCYSDGTCLISITAVQYTVARILHPKDWALKNYSGEVCRVSASNLEFALSQAKNDFHQ